MNGFVFSSEKYLVNLLHLLMYFIKLLNEAEGRQYFILFNSFTSLLFPGNLRFHVFEYNSVIVIHKT